jgi:surface antigen
MRIRSRQRAALIVIGAVLLSSGAAAAWQGAPGEGDKAYVPPVVDEPPLPALPTRPTLDTDSYPGCREDYRKKKEPFDQAEAINRCTVAIDTYYRQKMLPYREAMIAYQDALSALYSTQVGANKRYSADTQHRFFETVMVEHAASNPEGENLAAYRGMEAQYQTDRAYLADRFCFNTGCNGYPAPAAVATVAASENADKPKKKGEEAKRADSANPDAKCKRARKRGGALGGLIGGVAGSAAGLKGIGTAVSGLFGAVLVSEIACQLDEKEQKVAAEATVAVTKKEEVGATAKWTSPTREGVAGSSTITALNTEPNGSRCLSITDIAIVEGEETRVAKRMCRQKPGEPYSIMA